ncbi:MAG: SpoIIE family protein phosphatase [Bacteroides sp.]|nr:SpoIIE family protein phosphatase [Bacteroides sp.]
MQWSLTTISEQEQIAVIIAVGLALVMLHIFLIRKRRKVLLASRRDFINSEVESQKVVHQRNIYQNRARNIEDSLKYAQRIQLAMFTTPREMKRHFPESFIFQKPKDIVSGDFYWARRVKGKVLFSVADCTGHGVPGAFMSLIGLEFFRQIVVEKEILRPASILEEMNHYFDVVFDNLEGLSLKDGIDLGFCAYDCKSRTLEYAGAFNPLYVIRNNEVMEIKGDRIIVGPDYGIKRGPFTNRTIQMEDNDVIYMFSDGYADQFGGPEGKKFKYRRFRHLLMSIHHLPMEEQHKILEENIRDWMGDRHDQIDDLMVIGIRPASFSSF